MKPQPYSCTISIFFSYNFDTFEIIKAYEVLSSYSEYDIDLLKVPWDKFPLEAFRFFAELYLESSDSILV